MSIDDEVRRITEMQEAVRRAADPLEDARRRAGLDLSPIAEFRRQEEERNRILTLGARDHLLSAVDRLGIAGVGNDILGHRKLLSGVTDDLLKIGALDASLFSAAGVATAMGAYQQYEKLFRRPAFDETARLLGESVTSLAKMSNAYGFDAASGVLKSAIDSIKSPWLHTEHALLSTRSLAELYTIGHAINLRAPFDKQVASALRESLGDWRDVSALPPAIFDNAVVRSEFYIELGFNPALTDFPAAAFDEGTALAGFEPLSRDETDDKAGLTRTDAAQAHLTRFERRLRRFIDAVMTVEFGPDWVRTRTPSGMLDTWKDKKVKRAATGKPEESIVAFADFTDYLPIIEMKENWEKVFKRIFGRREDVKESFVRLYPVRNCAMHASLLTLDDELYLLAETTRLWQAIERNS